MFFHGCYILSVQPLIISFIGNYPFYLASIHQKTKENSFYQDSTRPFRPQQVLEHAPGWAAPLYRMSQFKLKQAMHMLEGRTHHLMVNASDEEIMRKKCFVHGGHFNHNIYINEHLYKNLSEHKIYDAIYTAQLSPYKRHWLAKKIEKLMVVSYGGDLHAFCPELKHAEFNREFIPRPELTKKYNQAYSGLCLSAKEGAMFASCEYLLCGIPIVSTPSKGGRDEFFDEQNSIIVTPEPDAVAQAVQHWKNNPPDPYKIRERTLTKMKHLRRGYCIYIAKLIEKGGGGIKNPDALMEQYFSQPDGIASRFVKFDDLSEINLEKYILN